MYAWGVLAGGAEEPPPPLRPPPPPLLSLEGGRMYGAEGPPARSASAPVVRSLRRPPPPATGSVGKGLRARSSPYGAPRWPRGSWLGAGYRVRARKHRKGVEGETRARGGDLDCGEWGKGGEAGSQFILQVGVVQAAAAVTGTTGRVVPLISPSVERIRLLTVSEN